MSRYSLTQRSDASLLSELPRIAACDRATTAELLAHLAEADRRRLYAAAGYSSMFDYCVRCLRYSDAAAAKRIHAAGIAHAYPILFEMLADGRMSLTTVLTLGPHLNVRNAEELIAAASGRSRSEIGSLLASRAPRSEMLEWGTAPASDDSGNRHAPGRVDPCSSQRSESIPVLSGNAALKPLDEERIALQLTVTRTTQQKLMRAKELLGFEVAGNDTAEVLERALDALIESLEKRRYGRHTKHRASNAANDPRHIPSALREEVSQRDNEQCTYVSERGLRCESRHALQFDHIVPLAQGGVTRADNLRLLCPAHNQYEADRRFGSTFMNARRQRHAPLVNHDRDPFPGHDDVRAALVTLGFRKEQIAPAMEFASGLPRETSAAERVRAILKLRGASRHQATVRTGSQSGEPNKS